METFTPPGPRATDLNGRPSGSARTRPRRAAVERAERLARTGTWEWDLESDELLWSENMYRLLGVRPGEVTPSPENVLSRMHSADRERVSRELDAARRDG